MSGAATPAAVASGGGWALTSGGPLFDLYAAIDARLRAAFPPAKFTHGTIPAKLTAAAWQRLTQRTPFVGLGWTGIRPDRREGRLFEGVAEWSVFLVADGATPRALLTGDALGPGILGMTQVACAALQGLTVPTAGTVGIEQAAHLYGEEWAQDNRALVALTIGAPVGLLTDPSQAAALADFDRFGITWAFSATPDPQEVLTMTGEWP